MNSYEPPDDDESQLHRIERKLDRLEGSYLSMILLGSAFTAAFFVLVEITGRWKF